MDAGKQARPLTLALSPRAGGGEGIAFWRFVPGRGERVERAKGIEPSSPAWEAGALPLCYAREGGGIVAELADKASESFPAKMLLHFGTRLL